MWTESVARPLLQCAKGEKFRRHFPFYDKRTDYFSRRYKTLPVTFLRQELGYEETDLAKLFSFLVAHSASTFTNPNEPAPAARILDLRNALPGLLAAQTAKYSRVGIKGSI